MLSTILWLILAIVIVGWLLGVAAHVGGSLIHLLLIVAVVILLFNLFTGRRVVA